MARDPSTRDLSDKHAEFIETLFDARITRGSGNQHRDQLDNRMDTQRHRFAFGFEGKATRHRSSTLKLDDWEKLVEQAHDLRPCLAHRFYEPHNLLTPVLDLITITAEDFSDVLAGNSP